MLNMKTATMRAAHCVPAPLGASATPPTPDTVPVGISYLHLLSGSKRRWLLPNSQRIPIHTQPALGRPPSPDGNTSLRRPHSVPPRLHPGAKQRPGTERPPGQSSVPVPREPRGKAAPRTHQQRQQPPRRHGAPRHDRRAVPCRAGLSRSGRPAWNAAGPCRGHK